MTVATANATSTGTLSAAPCTLLGLYVANAASAGSVVLKDGGASGTTKFTMQTAASAADSVFVPFPGGGLVFSTDMHATITNAAGVTAIYDA